jgi:hypothetical protein
VGISSDAVEVRLESGPDPETIVGTAEVREDTRFFLYWQREDEGTERRDFMVEVEPDAPPTVRLTVEAVREKPQAAVKELRVRVQAADDGRLTRAAWSCTDLAGLDSTSPIALAGAAPGGALDRAFVLRPGAEPLRQVSGPVLGLTACVLDSAVPPQVAWADPVFVVLGEATAADAAIKSVWQQIQQQMAKAEAAARPPSVDRPSSEQAGREREAQAPEQATAQRSPTESRQAAAASGEPESRPQVSNAEADQKKEPG